MSYSDTVRENLDMMADEELLSRVKAGALTEEAQVIAIQLLSARGRSLGDEDQKVLPATAEKATSKESDRAFLDRCISGKASLNDAFWVLGLGVWLAIGIPVTLLLSFTKGTPSAALVSVFCGVLFLVALSFRDVCIWRCAWNTRWIVWGMVARAWVAVSWALLVASVFSSGR